MSVTCNAMEQPGKVNAGGLYGAETDEAGRKDVY